MLCFVYVVWNFNEEIVSQLNIRLKCQYSSIMCMCAVRKMFMLYDYSLTTEWHVDMYALLKLQIVSLEYICYDTNSNGNLHFKQHGQKTYVAGNDSNNALKLIATIVGLKQLNGVLLEETHECIQARAESTTLLCHS